MKKRNLLNNVEFKFALRFEAGYASNVRGGYLPDYIDDEKKQRLVSEINFLTDRELRDLTKLFYTGKN